MEETNNNKKLLIIHDLQFPNISILKYDDNIILIPRCI